MADGFRVGVYRCANCGTTEEVPGREERDGWVPAADPPVCGDCGADMALDDLEYRTEHDYR